MELLGMIVGALVGAVVLYCVVRLAVLHAIRDSRRSTPTKQAPAPQPVTRAWFEKDSD